VSTLIARARISPTAMRKMLAPIPMETASYGSSEVKRT